MKMTFRKKMALPLAAACMVLGLMVVAQSATATHPRPKGASPFYASQVVAYESCPTELGGGLASVTATHIGNGDTPTYSSDPGPQDACGGGPEGGGGNGTLGPEQSSPYLTVGTPTLTPPHAAAANMVGFVKLVVIAGDVEIDATITDVRCRSLPHSEQVPPDPPTPPASLPCGAPGSNTTAGADYLGEIQGSAQIRITDHNSAPLQPATVADIPFPVTGACVATAAVGTGGTCTVDTTANAVCGCVVPGVRGNVELTSPLVINDGGPDGTVTTADNSLFLRSGIFIP